MTEREGEWEMTTFPMISYRQFDQWMEQGKIAQLVDLREPWMFEQDRIWGSVNIPYDELEDLMGEIRKDGTIVFYCDRGPRAWWSAGTCGGWATMPWTWRAEC